MAFWDHLPTQKRIILAPFFAVALAGFAQDDPFKKWRPPGSQRCDVETGDPTCNTTPTVKPGPTWEEIQARQQAREARRRQKEINARYRELDRQIAVLSKEAWNYPSAGVRIDSGEGALKYLREKLAIRDEPKTRVAIDKLSTWMRWNQGIIDAGMGNDSQAVAAMTAAMHHRPELFSKEHRREFYEIWWRNSHKMAQKNTRGLQDAMLRDEQANWHELRVFNGLSADASEAIRLGFKDIAAGDLDGARGKFQGALNRHSGNTMIAALISTIDYPSIVSSSPAGEPGGRQSDFRLFQPPSAALFAGTSVSMSDDQILRALFELVRAPALARYRKDLKANPTLANQSNLSGEETGVQTNRGPKEPAAVQLNPAAKLAETTVTPAYKPSGNAMIGGTTWKVAYFSPKNASPEVQANSLRMLEDQIRLQDGPKYNTQVDLKKYNFVIGIAASTDKYQDLAKRVWFDQLHNGKHSAAPRAADTREAYTQDAYNRLRGHGFDKLGCHSNGAMICLAALENGDITANDVTLYGPQITTESLKLWNNLMIDGKIKSLKIMINQNDPVPPVSLLLSPTTMAVQSTILSAPLFFSAAKMANAVRALAPSANVQIFPCGKMPTTDCHDMAVYTAHDSTEQSVSSGKTVPGTRLKHDKGVLEPPPPPSNQ